MMVLRIFVISLVLCVCVSKESKNKILRAMESRVVGGVPVNLDRYPHCAQIFIMGNMCAGSILNSWTVLTAAHCFDLSRELESVYVIVGARFTYDLNAPLHFVKYLTIHENYNVSGYFASDIALLFLEKPIEYNGITQKAIIVNTNKWMNEHERNFTVTGWGWTRYDGELSKLGLLTTHLRFIPLKKCARMHHNSVTFTEDMFCLYGEGLRDTCKGDSGGGVLWNNMIVGITSHGDRCAKKNSPSVYTNVWYFRKWIDKHIQKFIHNFCSQGNIKEKNHHDKYIAFL